MFKCIKQPRMFKKVYSQFHIQYFNRGLKMAFNLLRIHIFKRLCYYYALTVKRNIVHKY